MSELKPCPFCGRTNICMADVEVDIRGDLTHRYTIYCVNCNVEFNCFLLPGASSKEVTAVKKELRTAWNRRVEKCKN